MMDEHHETPNSYFSELLDSNSIPSVVTPLADTALTTIVEPTLHVLPHETNQNSIFLYGHDTSQRILSMATEDNEEHSKPFLQRVQLIGPSNYIVRATGQVDNGAMRNCISKRRWDQYGHCLSALQPSPTRISVANGAEIKPIGRWFGTVKICGVGAPSWFEVFDSHGAFDIILGKPWLRQVKAIHDYATDEIVINQQGTRTVITNTNPPEPEPTVNAIQTQEESSPREQMDREWARIHQLRASPSPWRETRWAKYLTVDPMGEDDEETPPFLHGNNPPDSEEESTIPLSEKDRRKCHADKRQTLRDEEGEILLANILQENEERYERERLSKHKHKHKSRTRKPKVTPISEDANHIHLLQESERRIKTLRSKLEHL